MGLLERAQSFRVRLALALATIYLLWGSTYLAIRYAVHEIPPFLMAGMRFLSAGILLYGWARWRGAERPTLAQWRSAAIVGGLLLLGGNGLVVFAEQTVDSGMAALMVSTTALWMVLLAWLWQRGAAPGPRVIAGLLLGLAGVALLVRPGSGNLDPLGLSLLGLSAFNWALGSTYSRKAALPKAPLLSTGMQLLAGGTLLMILSFALGEPGRFDLGAVHFAGLFSFVYLVIGGALIGYPVYIWLIKEAPPALASTYAYVNPVVAVFLGWAIADEPVGWGTVAAAAVIVAGVALISTANAMPNPKPSEKPATAPKPPREVRVRAA